MGFIYQTTNHYGIEAIVALERHFSPSEEKYCTALSEAARSAGVNTNEITDEEITLDNGYYEVRFTSDWMQYDCYVDAATGEVPGITSMPLPAA